MSNPTAQARLVVWLRRLGLVVLLLAGLFVLFVIGALFLPTRVWLVLGALLFGWWSFADRNLPQITLNWDLIGMAAVCVLGVLALSHLLLRRFARWHLRSTIALNGVIWLSFFTATAVAGAVEQARWLRAAEHEPLLVVTRWGTRAIHLVRSFSGEIERRVWDGMNVEAAVAGFQADNANQFDPPSGRYRDFRVFYLVNATNGYAGLIVFRRPEIVHPDHQIAVHAPDSTATEHPREQLGQLLSQPGLTAVPLF